MKRSNCVNTLGRFPLARNSVMAISFNHFVLSDLCKEKCLAFNSTVMDEVDPHGVVSAY